MNNESGLVEVKDLVAVPLQGLANLANILCDIDTEQALHSKNKAISQLVGYAHQTIEKLMGEHASNYYAKED